MSDDLKPSFIVESNLKIKRKDNDRDISNAYTRTWITREGEPYSYEFRGTDYMGFHKIEELEIIHG